MNYTLEFIASAEKEFRKLDADLRQQFGKKLKERLLNPRIPSAALRGMKDCYKIKLHKSGYRLVYQVIDERIVVKVIAVGKRECSEVYTATCER